MSTMFLNRRSALTRTVVLSLAPLGLAGCTKPPLKVAYLGGITGRTSDLGVGGRDAATLAVEQANLTGGVSGQQVVLESFDDQQDPAVAKQAFGALQAAGHKVVVGPVTSAMAAAVVPLADAAGILLVSPTVTSSLFTGKDDQLLRVVSSVKEYAESAANFHVGVRGTKRFAVSLDDGNAAYTRTWFEHFAVAARSAGADVLDPIAYKSSDTFSFQEQGAKLLALKPQAVLMLSSATDSAKLAQALRKVDANVQLMTAEWAATEQFLSLGGRAVEGTHVAQFLDRDSKEPRYEAFVRAFNERFQRTPGFVELAAYDATNVVLEALRVQQQGESIKAAVLRVRRFAGAQLPVEFDEFGDSKRKTFITVIENGRFKVVPT